MYQTDRLLLKFCVKPFDPSLLFGSNSGPFDFHLPDIFMPRHVYLFELLRIIRSQILSNFNGNVLG